uniref:Chemosensory protein n=1 Tax=Histia rhodope TaxID=1453155 RepID=A0A6M9BJS1_9NEOP|nr:chemosensory protein [Histia rhodope]
MKSIALFGLLALAVLATTGAKYTDKYDNTDIEEILNNDRLLLGYIKCVLDEGPCTPDGKELKSHIQEGLETNCAECTVAQRTNMEKIFRHLINKEHEHWEALKKKFDANNVYAQKYEDDLKKFMN